MDRRAFLQGLLGVGAVALAGCAAVTSVHVQPVDGVLRLRLAEHPGLAGPGGRLQVAPGPGSEPIYVLAGPDGEYLALSPRCTHQGCTVGIEGQVLVCPCHGSTYDRAGRVLRGPAERPLRRYTTRLEGGTLLISLGAT
ncbi:MAG TPA: ubiquinol-cytochrome c reductase iron-sulfur subunit [Longimicrobiales bacterium]|nr:ubiquinol-cytochrome c reductase iron-sulfur subunit [Longimicrobiales bacterium]